MQGTGIGPALRRARVGRGKSIDEVSRETRIRAEYLDALEGERFDDVLGDVYVRGFLRSYSSYLGLDPDKVLTVYNRHFGVPRSTLPEPTAAPARSGFHPHLAEAMRHHPSWAFLIAVALLVLAVLGAAGLLTRASTAPKTESLAQAQSSLPPTGPSLTVALAARAQVRVTVVVDGGSPSSFVLRPNEGRSFEAARIVTVRLGHGGTTQILVNGHSLGTPGRRAAPFEVTYRRGQFPSPSAGPSRPGPSGSASPGSASTEGSPSPNGG